MQFMWIIIKLVLCSSNIWTFTLFLYLRRERILFYFRVMVQFMGNIVFTVSPTSSMWTPYVAWLDYDCLKSLMQSLYPLRLGWAMGIFLGLDREAQSNYIEQAVDSGLRELRIFGFNISIDEFFNLSNASQLFILDFLGIRSHARAVGVFDHLNHNLWSRRCQLNRQNAICALASNRNPYSLNNLQYSPALDSHIDRVRDLTSRDILLEHQNLDDFICHSSHWEHVMDELKEHPKFLVADILL